MTEFLYWPVIWAAIGGGLGFVWGPWWAAIGLAVMLGSISVHSMRWKQIKSGAYPMTALDLAGIGTGVFVAALIVAGMLKLTGDTTTVLVIFLPASFLIVAAISGLISFVGMIAQALKSRTAGAAKPAADKALVVRAVNRLMDRW
jgi:hypothetical protein